MYATLRMPLGWQPAARLLEAAALALLRHAQLTGTSLHRLALVLRRLPLSPSASRSGRHVRKTETRRLDII